MVNYRILVLVTGRRFWPAVKKYAVAALLAWFLCCAGIPLEAQWRQPFPSLRVIKTERFDIVYPPESEKTAQTLAGFADRVYGQVSGLLGISVQGRILVTLTPYTAEFNGYMNPVPYSHIVLMDVPMSIENMAYANSLEGLFLHELTHAVSFSSRAPRWEGFHKIFGGWVLPVILAAPGFMVEGVTVSFESLDGTGRANDPLVKAGLLQAVYENAFLSPLQSSGFYDLPHIANPIYHYGGYFSVYLQQRYGMEKYAELWRVMGGGKGSLSFRVYNSGYYALFQKVYGRSFPDVWDEFRESLRISGIEENPEPPVFKGAFRRAARLEAVDAGGGMVFAADSISGKLVAYDTANAAGELRNVMDIDRQAVRNLAVSVGGERILVSSYRTAGPLNYVFTETRTVVAEYDVRRGRKTGREWRGISAGRYFRDGVIGISADRHNTVIVYRPDPSNPMKEETLLRGTEELLYSNPVPLNDTWIAFTAATRGVRKLCFYNYETQEAYTVVSDAEDDEERWKYLRGLGFYEGRLLFSYDHDGRMYKLGMADPGAFLNGSAETFEAVFSERDFSGGVFLPVMSGGAVYYRGAFASQDALMKFPEPGDALSGRRVSLSLRPWDDEERRAAALPGRIVEASTPADAGVQSSRFWGAAYLNPFHFWLPYPLIRMDPDSRYRMTVNGPGFWSLMMDPTDTNQIILNAALDIPYLMGNITLTWLNLSMGLPLTFEFSDTLDTSRSRYTGVVRETALDIRASFSRGLGSNRLVFSALPEFQVQWRSIEPPGHPVWTDGPKSAYTWDYQVPHYIGVLGLGLSAFSRARWEVFGQGVSLTAYGKYALRHGTPAADQALPRAEGVFQAAFEPYLPLRFRLYGVWDERGMNLAGQSTPFSSTPFSAFASAEYVNTGSLRMTDIPWIAGGEAEVKLFKVEIQRHLSHLYMNRLFGTLAYRGAVYDDQRHPAAEGTVLTGPYRLAQSLVLRLGSAVSFAVLPYIPFRLSASVVGVWKMSKAADGADANDFWIGPEITISL
ncbi:MAG: hypothetical protein LBH70_06950 [Spirochaetaceae bacterium]|nr:hypothetical protein [Spirochaetaceae bacterium]